MSDQRHPYSAELCDRLERIAWGESATALLETNPRLTRCVVVTLPVFAWGHTTRDTGRKSLSPTGELLFPVKIKWRNVPGPVVVSQPKERLVVSWEALGSSDISPRGKTEIFPIDGSTVESYDPPVPIPKKIYAPILSKIDCRRTLNDLVSDGRTAKWEILHIFEGNLRWNFARALRSVHAELGLDSTPVVDRAASETIQNTILLGGDGQNNSLALRLIDRCLEGDAFSRVDPEKYVRRALFSSAETAIRRYIGDPHIGRQVRQVSNQIQSEDIDLITEEFARQNPRARLGADRAKAALSTTRRVLAATPSLSFGDLVEDSECAARRERG